MTHTTSPALRMFEKIEYISSILRGGLNPQDFFQYLESREPILRYAPGFFRLTSGTVSLGDTAIDSRAVEVPPPERSTTLTLAVRSHECNVVLRFLAGYPTIPRRRSEYRGLRVVIAPPQARLHVSRAPPEGLDWSSTREGFSRRAIGRPPQAFEPAPNKQGGPASQPEPLPCRDRGGLRARPSAKDAPP